MPQLTFKGIKRQSVIDMSKELIDELQTIINVPREHFALEHVDSMYIMDGREAPEYPLIYVNLFDRGSEAEHMVAKAITKHVHHAGYQNVDVIFTILERSRYYENGERF
ncbi:MAG: hypothetical protein A2Y23_10080 [Clostridiales bacterium GWB2_37_7]|nr:MAG: hypothetical protein A2Y23_10080 [Clostridiales bacterium GWB2_37_7]